LSRFAVHRGAGLKRVNGCPFCRVRLVVHSTLELIRKRRAIVTRRKPAAQREQVIRLQAVARIRAPGGKRALLDELLGGGELDALRPTFAGERQMQCAREFQVGEI